jgi:hypothetical protein
MTAKLPRRAFLGAELPADAVAFASDGVWIAGVTAGGMADRAGLAAGDLLVSLAGMPLRDLCELAAALRAAGAAPMIELVYMRGTERIARTVEVTVQPCEPSVEYGELAVGGARLRTLATRVASPRALVVVIQGIACESIDQAMAPDAPLAGLVAGWTRAGFETLRFDKRGVGDSEGGRCDRTDFATELADARAALALAAARGLPLIVFGHSVGGIIAAQLAGEQPLAGIIVYGTPVMKWIDCLADSTRRQLELRNAEAGEIAEAVARIYNLAHTGELNGRSAAYHAQLAAVDSAATWRSVGVPVLVARGEHDWVVRQDDQASIAELARGATTIVDLPGLDHLFGKHADREASLRDYGVGAFDDSLASATVAWIDRIL